MVAEKKTTKNKKVSKRPKVQDPRKKLKKPGDIVLYRLTWYYMGEDKEIYEMTPKEKKFVEAYLSFDANGVSAVYEAGYKPKNARIASALASENLSKPNIFNYVHLLLDEYGFNDDNVDKQHFFLMQQNSDLKSKGKAIDMFYKLKGKYAPEKVKDVTDPYKELISLSIEELIERRKNAIAFLRKK